VNRFIGKTFTKVFVKNEWDKTGNDAILFYQGKELVYALSHWQGCCESVYIESIVGSLKELQNTPILLAEEVSSESKDTADGHATWTFYKFGTIKGYVDIRFFGESNGYYAEEASIIDFADCN